MNSFIVKLQCERAHTWVNTQTTYSSFQLTNPHDSINNLRQVLPFRRFFCPAGPLVEVILYLFDEYGELSKQSLSLSHQLSTYRLTFYQLFVSLKLSQQLKIEIEHLFRNN